MTDPHDRRGAAAEVDQAMTTDPHADLRAMLEALPADIQWEPQCGRIELRAPDGLTHVQMDDLMSWLLRAPALVSALLEERDRLAKHIETGTTQLATFRVERDALKEKLNEIIAKDRIALAKAEAAADAAWRERLLAFEELHLRCMMAATIVVGAYSDPNFNHFDAEFVHNDVDRLIAEARRRKEAGK